MASREFRMTHRWSGWPGAICLDCGAEDQIEVCVASCGNVFKKCTCIDGCDDEDSDEWCSKCYGTGVIPVNCPTHRNEHCLGKMEPMSRPNWIEYFLMLAHVASTRATCDRKKVGCVIVDNANQIIATGYNGSPRGTPHCDEAGHELKSIEGKQSCVRTLHAESNAIDFAGVRAKGCTLYCTCIPCYDCAKRIVNVGIKQIFYMEYYESRSTELVIDLFIATKIPAEQIHIKPFIELLCAMPKCNNSARYSTADQRGGNNYCSIHSEENKE